MTKNLLVFENQYFLCRKKWQNFGWWLNHTESLHIIFWSTTPLPVAVLFLTYINDPEKNIKSNIKFFVDDTMLFSIVKDPVISSNDLNHDLDIICHWAHQWKMEFNPDPTKQATEVLFSCKKSSAHHPQLIFNGTAVA